MKDRKREGKGKGRMQGVHKEREMEDESKLLKASMPPAVPMPPDAVQLGGTFWQAARLGHQWGRVAGQETASGKALAHGNMTIEHQYHSVLTSFSHVLLLTKCLPKTSEGLDDVFCHTDYHCSGKYVTHVQNECNKQQNSLSLSTFYIVFFSVCTVVLKMPKTRSMTNRGGIFCVVRDMVRPCVSLCALIWTRPGHMKAA